MQRNLRGFGIYDWVIIILYGFSFYWKSQGWLAAFFLRILLPMLKNWYTFSKGEEFVFYLTSLICRNRNVLAMVSCRPYSILFHLSILLHEPKNCFIWVALFHFSVLHLSSLIHGPKNCCIWVGGSVDNIVHCLLPSSGYSHFSKKWALR